MACNMEKFYCEYLYPWFCLYSYILINFVEVNKTEVFSNSSIIVLDKALQDISLLNRIP